MSEPKFTRGPWHVEATTLHAYITPPKGHYVASVILPSDTFHMSSSEKSQRSEMANAHLISAAPDLFEALRGIADWVDINIAEIECRSVEPEEGCASCEVIPLLDAARSALKKARGDME